MHSNLPALIFDYDGVIANTEVLHWKSWAAMLRPYEVHLTWEEYCEIGRGINDARFFEVIRKRAPAIDLSELASQNAERNRTVCRMSLAELPISPETIDLLGTLGAYRLGLVTSSQRTEVEPVLRAAGIYQRFEAAVFGNDVTAHKPAPEPYLLIARKMGVKTGVAFEDSAAGIASALAAGFAVVRIEEPKYLASAVMQYLRGEIIPQVQAAQL